MMARINLLYADLLRQQANLRRATRRARPVHDGRNPSRSLRPVCPR
jgi:hypothetical protein